MPFLGDCHFGCEVAGPLFGCDAPGALHFVPGTHFVLIQQVFLSRWIRQDHAVILNPQIQSQRLAHRRRRTAWITLATGAFVDPSRMAGQLRPRPVHVSLRVETPLGAVPAQP